MTPFFYPARNNWRVQIPASETETGKRTSRFFPTKEEAEEFIQEHYKAGSVQLAELSLHEKHVLGVIRQSSDYAALGKPPLVSTASIRFKHRSN